MATTTQGLSSRDIPDMGDLRRLRLVVETIHSGQQTGIDIAKMTRISVRHVGYAWHAARILGLVKGSNLPGEVTDLGRDLLTLPQGSSQERDLFRRAFMSSKVLQDLVPDLLADVGPSIDQLQKRIQHQGMLEASTARRRALALLRWRRQLLDQQEVFPDNHPPHHPSLRDGEGKGHSDRVSASHPSGKTALVAESSLLPLLPMWPEVVLKPTIVTDLRRENPWWENKPMRQLPPTRRDFVDLIRRRLGQDLAPITVVRGPRQVGKTTAQFQVISDLLQEGISPRRILRVQFDVLPDLARQPDPITSIVDWYEKNILGTELNQAARDGIPTFLFFDEVQNLKDWAIQLKHLVDRSSTRIMITGSSALRIEAGRDSLAGRINTIEVGTLKLNEIAAIRGLGKLNTALPHNGLEPLIHRDFWEGLRENGARQAEQRDAAFDMFSERGGYPMVHKNSSVPWPEVADQLNENVIKRVLQTDLRYERGRTRNPALLEEVFRLGCRYAGQCPGLQKLTNEAQLALHAQIKTTEIKQYLDFLDRSLLLRQVKPIELRLKKQSQASSKLCLADHGLRASWLQEIVPISSVGLAKSPTSSDLAGHIAESVAGSYLLSLSGLDLSHFPARADEPEVDFVITLGVRRIPIEIKYTREIEPKHLTGLRAFLDKSVYNASFGILVTRTDVKPMEDKRIICLPLSSLLLLR